MGGPLPDSFVQELRHRIPESERPRIEARAQDWIGAHPLPPPEQGFVNALVAVSGLSASRVAH